MSKLHGLREQIRRASSESEISNLLSKGKEFEMASDVTRRSWKSTAKLRIIELNNPPSTKVNNTSVESKKNKKKKN